MGNQLLIYSLNISFYSFRGEANPEASVYYQLMEFKMEHSGHGLQNDNKVYAEYMETVEDYLDRYLPVE